MRAFACFVGTRFQEIVDLNAVNVAVSDSKSQQVRGPPLRLLCECCCELPSGCTTSSSILFKSPAYWLGMVDVTRSCGLQVKRYSCLQLIGAFSGSFVNICLPGYPTTVV